MLNVVNELNEVLNKANTVNESVSDAERLFKDLKKKLSEVGAKLKNPELKAGLSNLRASQIQSIIKSLEGTEAKIDKVTEQAKTKKKDVKEAWDEEDEILDDEIIGDETVDENEDIFQSLLKYADNEGVNVSDLSTYDMDVLADYVSDDLGINVSSDAIQKIIDDEIYDTSILNQDDNNDEEDFDDQEDFD